MQFENNRNPLARSRLPLTLLIISTAILVRTGVSNPNDSLYQASNATSAGASLPQTENGSQDSFQSVTATPVENAAVQEMAEPESPGPICLSPGHPSEEGDKYYEAIINRKVVWYLTMHLQEAGHRVVLAVNDVPPDELFFSNLANDDERLWRQLEVMTPEEKANQCNDAGAKYLISIHHNFAYDGDVNETMVFYTVDGNYKPVHENVIPWAEKTAARLGEAMATQSSTAIADMDRIGFQLGVLSNAIMPGILTEGSFYSNPDERTRLNDDNYLEQEAIAIFNAFTAQFE